MSMNGHAKQTKSTLEALDFHLDEDASSRGVWVYWHPNDPSRRVKVFAGMSDIAGRKVRNLAGEIAGMSSAGERIPASIGENAKIHRQSERAAAQAKRAAEAAQREPYQCRADADVAARARAAEIAARERREREIRDLMRPGNGR